MFKKILLATVTSVFVLLSAAASAVSNSGSAHEPTPAYFKRRAMSAARTPLVPNA